MSTSNPTLDLPSLDRIPPLEAVRLWPDADAFRWGRAIPLGNEDLWFVSDHLKLWVGDDDEVVMDRLMALALRRVSLG